MHSWLDPSHHTLAPRSWNGHTAWPIQGISFPSLPCPILPSIFTSAYGLHWSHVKVKKKKCSDYALNFLEERNFISINKRQNSRVTQCSQENCSMIKDPEGTEQRRLPSHWAQEDPGSRQSPYTEELPSSPLDSHFSSPSFISLLGKWGSANSNQGHLNSLSRPIISLWILVDVPEALIYIDNIDIYFYRFLFFPHFFLFIDCIALCDTDL